MVSPLGTTTPVRPQIDTPLAHIKGMLPKSIIQKPLAPTNGTSCKSLVYRNDPKKRTLGDSDIDQ